MYRLALLILLAASFAYGENSSQGQPIDTGFDFVMAPSAKRGEQSAGKAPDAERRWFARVGVVGAIYHPGATIAASGQTIPGANATVSNNVSVTFDIGYDLTRNIAASLMVGIPPKPTITGEGAVAAEGEFGKVRYGPAVLTACYRARRWGAFQPYFGPGLAYAIILKEFDGSVSHLDVRNHSGFVLQGGANYMLSKRWGLFADFKEIWLAVNAHGDIADVLPITAHVKLNPSLVSAGIKYYFK